jgi:hypothetical protein
VKDDELIRVEMSKKEKKGEQNEKESKKIKISR